MASFVVVHPLLRRPRPALREPCWHRGVCMKHQVADAAEPPLEHQPYQSPAVARFHDEQRKLDVYIVGTIHGSATSASDVRNMIRASRPSCVLVELCQDRLVQMMKRKAEEESKSPHRDDRPWDERLAKLRDKYGGTGPAALAVGLTSIYTLQARLGARPGSEFLVASEEAELQGIPLVCGDAPASATIRNLYESLRPRSLLRTSSQVARRVLATLFARAPPNGVNVWRVLLSGAYLKDLVGLLAPAFLISSLTLAIFNSLLEAAEQNALVALASAGGQAPSGVSGDLANLNIPEWLADGMSLFSFLVLLACTIRFFEEIVLRRDEVLQNSIREAVELRRKNAGDEQTTVVVVAVVGLLHVNGILRGLERNA
ncbi:hypothetical protein FVE85_6528 [Porphyridium purpureum]|uniref:TraB domain-containing protein n=1 Tax=Porphyridium purpureum TaxID=35688 RepID=A0A5J4Z7Y5_PORPP|nr:hypothetical protein FVE85_6528 [Porphyridium purpureum]|eukprot:POR1657..scf295_1